MSDKPMTRRQRREAERAAAQAALRQEAEAEALAAAARRRQDRRNLRADLERKAQQRPGDSTVDATAEDSTADATTANRSTAAIARAGAAAAAKELEQEATRRDAVANAETVTTPRVTEPSRFVVPEAATTPAGSRKPARPASTRRAAKLRPASPGMAAGSASKAAPVDPVAPTQSAPAQAAPVTKAAPAKPKAPADAAQKAKTEPSTKPAPERQWSGRRLAAVRRSVRKPNALSPEIASRIAARLPEDGNTDSTITIINSRDLVAASPARAAAKPGAGADWARSEASTEEIDLSGAMQEATSEDEDSLPRSYRPRRGADQAARRNTAANGSHRTSIGTLGRASVLAVLAVLTIVIPLTGKVPQLTSFAAPHPANSAALQASQQATGSSLAAPIVGSDADVDTSTNGALNNVPDAATLARIKQAYANASQSCAVKLGASGEAAAFIKPPELYMPMIAGSYVVSSPFGYRLHPTLGYVRLHAGQDWSAGVGTPIYAAAAGTVTMAGMDGGLGVVTIRHELGGQVWFTRYLHMYQDGIYVKTGDQVQAGQLIAGVGSTGQSTGPHLHFEVRTADNWEDSSAVEPAQWLKDHSAVELSSDCK
ncbi:Glycyl-glycine endopeptidase ALE-1 precursor [Actinomyces bovis]|uniref:Glycyl-glycine endopeptidase ALE-1 n=1 Tax=Actinomyces bovis TaxID=1658 RepID=A0ABY1VQQ5_9ACTO|nr:M23 family metallopeptidase [Actinomyces bovis]SPT53383.1 Glycyl-glycine endopeptidase ALE-1 precursor [Actinomyces bovis]VEG52782.1 Glycyl-glycine endopeptidase ALE-1 precursor [Actinomyces israelii]